MDRQRADDPPFVVRAKRYLCTEGRKTETMRKIKHWAGYGTVMAGKVKDSTCSLHVHIEGNHECGLSRPDWDDYTPYKWLVHRFDKSAPDYYDRNANIRVRHEDGYTEVKGPYGLYVETCDYYFYY